MFVAVTLKHSLRNVFVPDKWVDKLLLAECANGGVNSALPHIVFYSADKSKLADFSLRLNTNFDENQDSCYQAFIIKYFGELVSHILSQ